MQEINCCRRVEDVELLGWACSTSELTELALEPNLNLLNRTSTVHAKCLMARTMKIMLSLNV